MNTQSSSVKWVVEVYPFSSSTPSSDDFSSSFVSASVIASPALQTDIGKVVDSLSFKDSFGYTSHANYTTSFGLNNIDLSRSKGSPNATCSFSMVGPLDSSFVVGNWVVVSSAQQDDSSIGMRVIPKFLGQIESINVNYMSDQSGAITINSSILLKEWSHVLNTDFVFDFNAIQKFIQEANVENAAIGILNTVASNSTIDPKKSIGDMKKLLESSFDPFESAHVILKLIGVLSDEEAIGDAKGVSTSLHELAVAPPDIPASVLARFGMTSESNPTVFPNTTSWNGGFCTVVSGIKPPDKFRSWNGVFKKSEFNEYKQKVMDSYEKRMIKPKMSSALLGLVGNFSAWNLLNNSCESTVNEVYTDMWYQYQNDNSTESIVPRPVIVVRDKPLMIKEIFYDNKNFPFTNPENKEIILNDYTFLDDLPRINIPRASVVSAAISADTNSSPNYFKSDIRMPSLNGGDAFSAGIIKSIIRVSPEQRRFGGKAISLTPRFILPDFDSAKLAKTGSSNTPFETLFTVITELARMWYAYNYRFGKGSISIIDDNIPLSVGFNANFSVGNFDLVGHIDSINTSFTMSPDGQESTVTTLGLSMITYVPKESSTRDLRLLPPDAFSRFFDKEYADSANRVKDTATGDTGSIDDKLRGLIK